MKKKNILWLIVFALLMPLFALTACSDDDDDDNDSNGDKTEQTTNDGTKVQSKKITKIVLSCAEGEEYIFDDEGKIQSRTHKYKGSVEDIKTYKYTDNMIVVEKTEVNRDTEERSVFNIENGLIISAAQYDDNEPWRNFDYTYANGYLSTIKTSYSDSYSERSSDITTYSFSNENITNIIEEWDSNYDSDSNGYECNFTYDNSKLNDLNVDLALLLLEEYLPDYVNGYLGKRIKNLPSSRTHKKILKTGDRQDSEVYTYNYTFEDNYPVKIDVTWLYRGGDSGMYTYEIFYNE